ncbi:MAG TPA: ABC transporter permease subunit [Gemmataceae bacterium]|nr:ABC transporter permease subunit [Gemmataceae bacterium]
MTFSTSAYLVLLLLLAIQLLAAVPWAWLLFLKREDVLPWLRRSLDALKQGDPAARRGALQIAAALVAVLVAPLVFIALGGSGGSLEILGYGYGAVLQMQLLIDAFIVVFVLLLNLWPKGGAIALAAFREGVRQPMFWLLFGVAFAALTISPFIPYWTFGEDHLVIREIGYDTILLIAAVFGTIAASMSISEEIEGRTAVTLMSKPVSRRHFLIGKFLGIILAAGVLFALLGTYFEGVTLFKPWWDKSDQPWWDQHLANVVIPNQASAPPWITSLLRSWALPGIATDFLRGIGLWTHLALDIAPGLILGFSQVMVLIAIAVSLATRVPMVVNLVAVVVVFFLAHLAPVLVSIGYEAQRTNPGAAVSQILYFMAQLFDLVLPNLESFRLEPALLSELDIKAADFTTYLASVSLYGVLYTSIVLLFGLILFEDRDLA